MKPTNTSVADILKNVPLFSGLTEEELNALSRIAAKKVVPKNTILFTEGDHSDSLYVICKGKIKVTISDNEGNEVILSILDTGDYFGEMSLIDSEPRSATVVSKEPTELLVFAKKDFMEIFSSNPIAFNLLKGLLKRIREANKQIESLALLDVYGRVARLLNSMAKSVGEKFVVEERLTHQEIANMIGSSREMVTLILKELTNGGYVTVENKTYIINKKLPYSW
jgi:CRP/FNR family cyclic AMP-dependent transcriptional regulator